MVLVVEMVVELQVVAVLVDRESFFFVHLKVPR